MFLSPLHSCLRPYLSSPALSWLVIPKDSLSPLGRAESTTADISSNSKRLLHPGAETNDVLTQYISTIRCLRILDPPGVLLHKVAEPIRKHLRDRPDTIKHIVAALVEGDELQDESENGGGGLIKIDGNEDELEDFLDPRWEPEPIDAAPGVYLSFQLPARCSPPLLAFLILPCIAFAPVATRPLLFLIPLRILRP